MRDREREEPDTGVEPGAGYRSFIKGARYMSCWKGWIW